MGKLFDLFDNEKRHYAKAQKLQALVLAKEQEYASLSDEQLKNKTVVLKEEINKGKSLEDILPDAFATAREAAKRVIGEFPYPVQVLGGVLIHYGDIAEMKTGEGKTLTATMPIYLNALEGKGAHVVTVNEYLASRDANWMGEIYRFLGLTVGVNLRELMPDQKREAFNCDITYTTNAELGFDYLRDNMVVEKQQRVLRGLHYAIIDEVDSVLIDEARTPLIISGMGEVLSQEYLAADGLAKRLKRDVDVQVEKEENAVHLTESGIKKAEAYYKVNHLFDKDHANTVHYIQNALRANFIMARDVEYVVSEDEIVLVDQFTGRKMEGREFSDGLHQAIQAKENVGIKQETITLATITYQNFFRLYDKLSGMTGTAKTEEKEFLDVYNMRVYVIPTNKPVIRTDEDDAVFLTKKEKYEAIINEVVQRFEKGQPVLLGTISVGMSENLSKMLKSKGIPHQVLNAKEDAKEAQIIAQAGQRKTVTIATNMAGRGTDIKLGEGVVELGGLVVLGSERHESRRIDNQLRGRSGRQGDPGYSRFFVSMEDDLIERYSSDTLRDLITSLKEDTSEDKLRKLVNQIQERAEGINFDQRKNVLEFDDVLMEQRRMVYKKRDEILDQDNIDDILYSFFQSSIEEVLDKYHASTHGELNNKELVEALREYKLTDEQISNDLSSDPVNKLTKDSFSNYRSTFEGQEEVVKNLEKRIFLSVMDRQWIDHVDNMDRLKKAVGLRGYAQIKPIDAYKEEGYERFNNMMHNISEQTVKTCLNIQVQPVESK